MLRVLGGLRFILSKRNFFKRNSAFQSMRFSHPKAVLLTGLSNNSHINISNSYGHNGNRTHPLREDYISDWTLCVSIWGFLTTVVMPSCVNNAPRTMTD
jgi:hypothetical protein